MLKFNDFINEAKKDKKEEWHAGAGTAKMSEADMDESGLRMAAHAAHKEGKKEFEFKGKTYPVKVQKEEVELEEGKMGQLAADIKDLGDDEFHKVYGKHKHEMDPSHFKKPVQKGHEMDRAKALAQRGIASVKEEAEQIDEISKETLKSYIPKAAKSSRIHGMISTDYKNAGERARKPGMKKALSDLSQKYKQKAWDREKNIDKAVGKLTKEEVSQEMSPYVKGTLAVMDEGKIDDLRDAQKLRHASQSAYDPNFKPDTSHPHIKVVKGTAYGGANQKDDETDEKPDETKEKRGRGRPAGSKSGARV